MFTPRRVDIIDHHFNTMYIMVDCIDPTGQAYA